MRVLRPLWVLLIVAGVGGLGYAVLTAVSGATSSEPVGAADIMIPMAAGMVALGVGLAGLLTSVVGGAVDRDDVGDDARPVPATIVDVRSGRARERYSRRTLQHLTAELDDGGVRRTVTTRQWVSDLGLVSLAASRSVTAWVSAGDPEKVWLEV